MVAPKWQADPHALPLAKDCFHQRGTRLRKRPRELRTYIMGAPNGIRAHTTCLSLKNAFPGVAQGCDPVVIKKQQTDESDKFLKRP